MDDDAYLECCRRFRKICSLRWCGCDAKLGPNGRVVQLFRTGDVTDNKFTKRYRFQMCWDAGITAPLIGSWVQDVVYSSDGSRTAVSDPDRVLIMDLGTDGQWTTRKYRARTAGDRISRVSLSLDARIVAVVAVVDVVAWIMAA